MSKPVMVYLPGLDGTGTLFNRQAASLAATFEILPIALPLVASWAELVDAVLRQLPVARSLYVCGESFGGCLALLLATLKPLSGLILVNPASSFQRLNWLSWLSYGLPLLPDGVWAQTSPESFRILAVRDRISETNWRRFRAAVATVDKATACTRVNLLRQFPRLPLHEIVCPTLILASERDRLLPSVNEAHRLASQITQAKVQHLPASGHACLLENELDLNEILQRCGWLSLDSDAAHLQPHILTRVIGQGQGNRA